MDSRDSSSFAAASRDGPVADEDGFLSVTDGLANEAALLFQSRRFKDCVDVLNQLLQKKEDNQKVLHNIAVAEYFSDGYSDPRKLLSVLSKVKKRCEELARPSGEQEVVNNLGNSVNSGSKSNSNTQHQLSVASGSSTVYIDEFDTSVTTLNIATILFHLHEYANASTMLEPIYQNIEPIHETTALHVCLLLLDIVLASQVASKAADIIQYVEKAFGVGYMISQGDNGGSTQHQSSNQAVKASSAPNSLSATEASKSDLSANANASENPLLRTLSDEALDYETLLSTLNSGGPNLARPAGLTSSNDLSRASADRPAPADDLKLKLHLYKVRLLLLTTNLKAAKREVKLAMNIARDRDSSTVLLLKAQLEYARGNYPKAIKLLATSSNRTESWISSMFNNNMGCIAHQLGKHHTSAEFFRKALTSSSSLRSEKTSKLSTFSQDKSLLIMYNSGLQYLTCGRPILAARCFYKASLVFKNWPLLWLRLAECCILTLEKGLLNSSEAAPTEGEEVRVHVVGKGKWRHLVVEDGASRYRHLDSLEKDDRLLLGSDGQCRISMRFSRMCLVNALHLLNTAESKLLKAAISPSSSSIEDDEYQAESTKNLPGGDSKASNIPIVSGQANVNGGDAKEPKGGVSPNTTLQNSVYNYEDIRRRESHMIKQAVLADMSFVELTLGNFLEALSTARSLLGLPECSRIYIFLGHLYAAEALCRLNRPKEAAEQLSVYVSDGNKVEMPYSEDDRGRWQVEKGGGDGEELNGGGSVAVEPQGMVFLEPEEARGTLFVNLAAVSAMQGELGQAHRFATEALSTIPNSPKAVLTAVYVDLLLGKTQEAVVKLRQCSHVRFLSRNVTLNSSSS